MFYFESHLTSTQLHILTSFHLISIFSLVFSLIVFMGHACRSQLINFGKTFYLRPTSYNFSDSYSLVCLFIAPSQIYLSWTPNRWSNANFMSVDGYNEDRRMCFDHSTELSLNHGPSKIELSLNQYSCCLLSSHSKCTYLLQKQL